MSDNLPAQASRAQATLTRPGLSEWFIKHPIGTTLLTLGIVLLGIVAFPLLAVAPMPEAELPTMQINAKSARREPGDDGVRRRNASGSAAQLGARHQ